LKREVEMLKVRKDEMEQMKEELQRHRAFRSEIHQQLDELREAFRNSK
jgi:hypothetical protein